MAKKEAKQGPMPELSLIELLKRSCERLPRLVELEGPPHIILNEVRLLTRLALEALDAAMGREIRERFRKFQEAQLADWESGSKDGE